MRIPVLASIQDMGLNLGGQLNAGFNASYGAGGSTSGIGATNIGSVGGFLTGGGLAVAGAGLGALAGTQIEGAPIGAAAAVGAVAGFAALPTVGYMAGGITRGATALGKAAWANKAAIGRASLGVAGGVLKGAQTLAANSPLVGRLGVGAVTGFASKLVDWEGATSTLGKGGRQTLLGKATGTQGVKLTGLGQSVLWGASVVQGAAGAFKAMNESRMGTMDGAVTKATPRGHAFANNAGATGDLVFALNNNRRG